MKPTSPQIKTTFILALLGMLFVLPLSATDGYFSNGFGIRYKGMAGAGIGLNLGSLAGANNPAAMVFAGKCYDFEISLFNPNREYTITGAPSGFPGTFGLAPGTVKSGSSTFFIPAIGANWMWGENKSIGINIFGNGGMNTDYDNPTFGFKPTGVNLIQLFVAPTFSIKIHDNHSFGITPIFAYQSFEAKGLVAFSPYSSDATKLSDNGNDSGTGFGVRIGYMGKLTDFLSVGAAFQTKTVTSEFSDYAGLFAGQGDFDIPMNWTAGVGLHFDKLDVALDVKQIYYSQVESVGNPLLPNLQQSSLGNDNGAGFGWEDVTVFKAGVSYQVNDGLALRAGYSFGKQPIPESEVLFNILAPGVIEQHVTFGLSKNIGGNKEINFFVMRALSNSVEGANPLEAPGAQTIRLKMDQWEMGIGFSF